jgi:hypothetical protein
VEVRVTESPKVAVELEECVVSLAVVVTVGVALATIAVAELVAVAALPTPFVSVIFTRIVSPT